MYVDCLKIDDTVHVVERRNGKRIFQKFPAEYVFYIKNPKGTYKSIYGDPLLKYQTSSYREFQKEVKSAREGSIFEHDMNPVIRFLSQNYRGCDSPELHVAFFDIEVDFDPARGFSSPEDPYCPVNAASVYQSWTGKNITLTLKPKTLSVAEAKTICDKFDNTYLCKDEKEFFTRFLDLIADADVVSGWNCLDRKQPIYLNDRVISLESVKPGYNNIQDGKILAYNDSGYKKENILKSAYGFNINASDEHKIPVLIKNKNEYKYPSSLLKSKIDMTVAEIKSAIADNKNVYFIKPKIKNTNNDLTFRQYLIDYLDLLLEYPYFDFRIVDIKLRDKIKKILKSKGTLDKYFPHREYHTGKNFFKKSRVWCYSNWKHIISKEEIIQQFIDNDLQSFQFSSKQTLVDISKPISNDLLQLIGLTFTDGFYSLYDKSFNICSKYKNMLDCYTRLMVNTGIKKQQPTLKEKKQDKCYYTSYSRNTIAGLLYPIIYQLNNKKEINLEIFSRLSTSQFMSFISGFIDGDGNISDSIRLYNFENQSSKIQTLLDWNSIFCSFSENIITINSHFNNKPMIDLLKIYHPTRGPALDNINYRSHKNTPRKQLDMFEYNDFYAIRIKSIEETNRFIEMADIMTESQYFICSGIKVHNSTSFDVPYLIRRLERIKNKEATKKFCLWNQYPKMKTFEKFGKEHITYDLAGIVHLDYLDLYQKHTYHEMHSYRLDNVAEYEVEEKKVPYDGSLDKLYNEDYEKFLAYNRQDVMLLVRIDNKLKFIDLSNQLAHENTVLLQTTLGSVALIDQAIINEIHDRGLIAPSKKRSEGDEVSVAGAYVANPKKGMHDWIGSVDINSLYPSVIRSLNMSPETIIGQFKTNRTTEILTERVKKQKLSLSDAWHDFFGVKEYQLIQDQTGDNLICAVDNSDQPIEQSARKWHQEIYSPESGVCLSANGTLFRTDIQGIIPGLLEKWYAERVQIRKEAKEHYEELTKLEKLDKNKDKIDELKKLIAFKDKRQLIRKIGLNSLYGALLNPYSRFFDQRLGQSVTLTGRCINKHMISTMNELFTGVYDYQGECVIYGDTDSLKSDTLIETNIGPMTLRDLFNNGNIKWSKNDEVELSSDDRIKVLSFDKTNNNTTFQNYHHIYRRKVSKPKWKIIDENDNIIEVTDDHSVMVKRDSKLIQIKPSEIKDTDLLITIKK